MLASPKSNTTYQVSLNDIPDTIGDKLEMYRFRCSCPVNAALFFLLMSGPMIPERRKRKELCGTIQISSYLFQAVVQKDALTYASYR